MPCYDYNMENKKLLYIEKLLREALRVMVEEQGQEVERLNLLFLLLLLSKRDTDLSLIHI